LDHPYGHGRAEYLAGLVLSAIIVVMGFELGKTSLEKILHPEPMEVSLLPAIILIVSIAVKFYMSRYNKAVGKKINSAAMEATATDSLSDCIATSVVLLSMVIAWIFNVNVDGWAGLLVAAFIIFAGYSAMRDTLSPLLGKAPEPEIVQEIEAIALSHPEIIGIHDLIMHDYGPGRGFVSLHAEVNGNGNIFELHDAVDQAERQIREKFGILATIHMDPIDCENEQLNELRHMVAEKVKEINPEIRIHDFRMVPGPTHSNLIFDALIPVNCEETDHEMEEKIENLVHTTWEKYYAVVDIDRSFV
jgi:cation diffusion facilitator family transporter